MQVPTTDPGLLEREATLDELAAALERARRGRGHAVLIGADAGAGKTSVVREFSRRLDDATSVLLGACDPLSTPRPLGPFHDLVTRGHTQLDTDRIGASAGAVFGWLRELLSEQTTVLVLEDLHWADEATLDVLRLIVRRIESLPTLLIGTYRDDELRREHPMRTLLGDLATSASLSRLGLRPLSLSAVTTLAAGSGLDPVTLHDRTGGNAFFVTEVLAHGSTAVPSSVRDSVLTRATELTEDAAALLEVIALVPPLAEAWLIDRLTADSGAAVDACLASGLVVTDGEGVRFRHELSRLAVEQELPPTRRIALHRRILEAFEEQGDRAVDAARLAHHAEGAEDARAVLRHARRAAREAARAGAYREAASQYRRVLRFGSGLSDGDRAELLEGLSRACYLADDQVAAITEVRKAIDCRRRQGQPGGEARALVELAGYLSCRGHLTESDEVVARAVDLVADIPDSVARAHVDEYRARRCADDLSVGAACGLAERARAIGARADDVHVTGNAMVTLGSLTMTFDRAGGISMLEDAVRWADDRGVHEIGARALNNLAARSASAGDRHDAREYATRAIAYCTEHVEDLWRINALAIAARNALELGRWDEAVDHANAILRDPRDSPWPHHEALLVLALVRVRRGDPGATSAVDQAAAVGVPADEVTAHADLAVAGAEIAWTERRLDDVDRITTAAMEAARRRQDRDTVARLAFWRRMAGLPDDTPEPWPVATGDWSPPYESTLSGLSDDDAIRGAHDALLRQGALPASRIAARRLRDLGIRGVELGPRNATRQHPAGLTPRECDVVELLAEGLRNGEIAERLVISRRTVDHHVAAIMRKLDARTRGEAVARIAEIELALS